MGKRSEFERVERDFYPTPRAAVAPLLPFLEEVQTFSEPCAGDGRLARFLCEAGIECVQAFDIEPQDDFVAHGDALRPPHMKAEIYITNPPWSRGILHPIIETLSDQAPTWLLFDADWMHTRQVTPYLPRLRVIVSVGRLKWIEDSTMTGKDNCCWYLFDRPDDTCRTHFYGRTR